MNKVGWRLSTHSSTVTIVLIGLIVVVLLSLSACKPKTTSENNKTTVETTATTADSSSASGINTDQASAERLANQLWQQGLDRIRILAKKSSALQDSIQKLLAEPSTQNLNTAQTEWKGVFLLYQELLPFLFIEHSSLSNSLTQWRFALAAWPLQPGYLDSYDVYIQSGIVNDITLPLSRESLRKQHGLTDIEEATLGLYAIEYLLWGDKETTSPKRLSQQSKVPLAFEQAGLKVNELPNNRRRQLLELQSQILVEDIASLAKQWQEKGILSALFSPLSPKDKLVAFHTGLSNNLNEIKLLLAYDIDEQHVQKNSYPSRFNSQRRQAIKKQLDAIESLYFSNISGHKSKGALSLAEVLLSLDEKKNTLEAISLVRNKLGEIEKTNNN